MNNERSFNDARLDRAIDRAVRELMHVDPTPGLRRRVLSRINAPVERRTLPMLRYSFAVAAVVVLALVVGLIPGHVEPPTPPKAPPLAVATGIPVPSLDGRMPPVEDGLPARERATGITKERITMPRVTNVFGDGRGEVSAATVREPRMNRIVPETLAPLKIVPLSARPIVMEPRVLRAPR